MLRHRDPRGRTTLLVLLGLAPILFYYVALYRLSLPAPILDDFNTILNFLSEQRHLHGVVPRIAAAVQFQHGDYRWMLPHLLMAAQTALYGHPDFSLYILLGNIFMLPAVWLLWLHAFPDETPVQRLQLFLPVVFLLFQFTYVEMLDFASAGIQFLVLPFVLASLHLLLRGTRRAFLWACALAVLACGTAPQGFFLAPLGLGILLLPAPKAWRIAAWTFTFSVTLFAYLYHYHRAPYSAPGSLASYLLFLLSFVGGSIENMHREPVPYGGVVLGLLLCFTFLHSIATRYHKTHPLLFLTAVWTYMTALLITYARHSFGLPQSLAARYKLFSSVLMALSYLYWVHRVRLAPAFTAARGKTLLRLAYALSMLFCLGADLVGLRFLQRRHNRTLSAYAFYRQNPSHNAPYINDYINGRENGEAAFELEALQRAIANNVYVPPVLPAPPPGK